MQRINSQSDISQWVTTGVFHKGDTSTVVPDDTEVCGVEKEEPPLFSSTLRVLSGPELYIFERTWPSKNPSIALLLQLDDWTDAFSRFLEDRIDNEPGTLIEFHIGMKEIRSLEIAQARTVADPWSIKWKKMHVVLARKWEEIKEAITEGLIQGPIPLERLMKSVEQKEKYPLERFTSLTESLIDSYIREWVFDPSCGSHWDPVKNIPQSRYDRDYFNIHFFQKLQHHSINLDFVRMAQGLIHEPEFVKLMYAYSMSDIEHISQASHQWMIKNKGIKKQRSGYLPCKNLRSIPQEIGKFLNLRYLDLSHNRIQRLEDYSFKELKKLEILYLNDNQITEIAKEAFSGLRSLCTLDFRGNPICVKGGTVCIPKKVTWFNGRVLKKDDYVEIDSRVPDFAVTDPNKARKVKTFFL